MKDDPNIGCGYWPLLLEKTAFKDACGWHDETYLEKSWHQKNLPRKDIDKLFLFQMLEIAGTRKLRRLQAYTFYGLARVFGSLFWEGKR